MNSSHLFVSSAAGRKVTPVSGFTLAANFGTPSSFPVTANQNRNCSSWPWLARQPPRDKSCSLTGEQRKYVEMVLREEWLLENSPWLLHLFDSGFRDGTDGGERGEVSDALAGGCDHEWLKRDSGEGKARRDQTRGLAMVMHVTSMKPRREKPGTGSAPLPVSQYLCSGAPTPIFPAVTCLVFLSLVSVFIFSSPLICHHDCSVLFFIPWDPTHLHYFFKENWGLVVYYELCFHHGHKYRWCPKSWDDPTWCSVVKSPSKWFRLR